MGACAVTSSARAYNLVEIDSAKATYFYDSDFWGLGNVTLSGSTLRFKPTGFSAHVEVTAPGDFQKDEQVYRGQASILAVAKSGYQFTQQTPNLSSARYNISPDGEVFGAYLAETDIAHAGTYTGGIFVPDGSADVRSDSFGSALSSRGASPVGNLYAGEPEIGLTGPKALSFDTIFSLEVYRLDPGTADIALNYATYKFTIDPVPEPQTYAMLLGGLILFGALARRRAPK
ncbi:hypothetical protein RugamoR57_00860 [Duganella caerulea]